MEKLSHLGESWSQAKNLVTQRFAKSVKRPGSLWILSSCRWLR